MKKYKNVSKIKNIITQYTKNNSKEYILVILICIIGLFVGVMFINNCSKENENIITTYILSFIEKTETIENIDKTSLMVTSIKNNVLLSLIIWLAGTTIIGMPVVLGLILFRGFCLGYTISAINLALGVKKGILFCLATIFIQNILFIPALLTMGVSSIKLYKSIITDRRKENIKVAIIRHTIISLMMLIILILSSFIESKISTFLLKMVIKYIKN